MARSGPFCAAVLLAASVVGSTACGENIFEVKWTQANPDTVLLYTLARPEINLISAFDFLGRVGIRIHSPGASGLWDLVVDTQDGELVFVPPGGLDIESGTMIAALPGQAFDDVLEAPGDTTLYSKTMPLLIETTSVYVLRTHEGRDRFGFPCSFYGKLQPLEVDPVLGIVRFVYDVSVLCDDRGLVPED